MNSFEQVRDLVRDVEAATVSPSLALMEQVEADEDFEWCLGDYVQAYEDHQKSVEQSLESISLWLRRHHGMPYDLEQLEDKYDYVQWLFDEGGIDPIWSMYLVRDYCDNEAKRMLSEYSD